MTPVVVVVALVCAIAWYLTWTAARLDRLVARVETAWNALDAQLVRRAAVAGQLAGHVRRHRVGDEHLARAMGNAALAAQEATVEHREALENELSGAIRTFLAGAGPLSGDKTERLLAELDTTSARVGFARQFYNDAVRDHGTIRARRVPRVLARGKPKPPPFFEIDDTALPDLPRAQRVLP